MSWRIDKIEIENFKFFKNVFPINVDGKNILLYGENGAGKSSIYWSVYTHFKHMLRIKLKLRSISLQGMLRIFAIGTLQQQTTPA